MSIINFFLMETFLHSCLTVPKPEGVATAALLAELVLAETQSYWDRKQDEAWEALIVKYE